MWEHIGEIIAAASGSLGTGAGAAIYALIRRNRSRKQKLSLEEAVRKELWDEIGSLRTLIREANKTLVDWQGKYFELITSHQKIAEELVNSQRKFTKLAGILNAALTILDRIQEVERHAGENPDLLKVKQEIAVMRVEALTIRSSAEALLRV